jgi:uncharacterized lipoprotein YehR (DUF1307 family)
MKRIISLVLISILLLCCISLYGCEKKQEYKRVKLTTENYTNYISINSYATDYNVSPLRENSLNKLEYCASATIHVVTSKRADCYFENVTIEYKPSHSILWETSNEDGGAKVTLDYNGNSHYSGAVIIDRNGGVHSNIAV